MEIITILSLASIVFSLSFTVCIVMKSIGDLIQ